MSTSSRRWSGNRERDRSEPQQPGDGLGAGRADQLDEGDDLLQGQVALLTVLFDLRVHEPADQVVLRVSASLLQEFGKDGKRVVGDLAVLADEPFAPFAGSGLHRLALLHVEAGVGPLTELACMAFGEPEQRQDDCRRQHAREAVDVVELRVAGDVVEEVTTQRGDLRLEIGDAPRGEGAADELAQLRVPGRVHHDHHRDVVELVADHLEHDPVTGDEGLRVEQAVEHVLVATERVELVLLVPVDRRLVAEALPDRVRIGVDRVVPGVVVEVGRRHRHRLLLSGTAHATSHPPPFPRPTPLDGHAAAVRSGLGLRSAMGNAIGQLLPYAVGVAVSPMPIIAMVLMLLTPRARAGWVHVPPRMDRRRRGRRRRPARRRRVVRPERQRCSGDVGERVEARARRRVAARRRPPMAARGPLLATLRRCRSG